MKENYLKHIVVAVVGIGSTYLTGQGVLGTEALMLIYGNIMMYVFKNGNNALKNAKKVE